MGYHGLVGSALAPRFAESTCFDLETISLYLMTSDLCCVMYVLMMVAMLLRNLQILSALVIDLLPLMAINLTCMLFCTLAKRWTPMFVASLFRVIVCHSFCNRSLLIDGIRKLGWASLNLENVWSFFCSAR